MSSSTIPLPFTKTSMIEISKILIQRLSKHYNFDKEEAINKFIYGNTTLKKHSTNKPVQLGLCCCNTELRKKDIYASRKMMVKSVHEKGIPALKEKIIQNLKDILTMKLA